MSKKRFVIILTIAVSLFVIIIYSISILKGASLGARLFYDSDFLLFPSLFKDLFITKAPFIWKFSTQLFLFPDFILYIISTIITPDFRLGVLTNGIINILITISLIFLILKVINYKKKIIAVLVMTFSLILITFEGANGVISYMFTGVAYYGAFIYALASILLLFYVINNKNIYTKKKFILYFLFVIGASLTSFSDPLYNIIFLGPLAIFLLVAFLFKYLSLKTTIFIAILNTISIPISLFLRNRYILYLGKNSSKYVAFDQFIPSIKIVLLQFKDMLFTQQRYELIAVSVCILIGLISIVYIIRKKKSLNILLIAFLASVFPLVNLLTVVISGNNLLRYLLPTFLFPIIFCPILLQKYIKTNVLILANIIFLIVFLIYIGTFNISGQNVVEVKKPIFDCMQTNLDKLNLNYGVASYWDARPLDLYLNNKTVLAVNKDLTPFYWLTNLYQYINYKPEFAVSDSNTKNFPEEEDGSYLLNRFGPPTSIFTCSTYTVYNYKGNVEFNSSMKNIDVNVYRHTFR